jgi:hypothetical protein
MRTWLLCGLLFLLPIVGGCGPGQGRVTGRVLYGGKPIAGRLTFRPADPRQNSVSAEVDERGNYEAVLPAGDVRVCFDNRELEPLPGLGSIVPPGLSKEALEKIGKPANPGGAKPNNPRSSLYVKIPERYHDIETADLQFNVKGGPQQYDVELTP